MGTCKSCLKRAFEKQDWSQQRKQLLKNKDDLYSTVALAKADEFEINAHIKKLKRAVNEIYFQACKRKKNKSDPVVYSDSEVREIQSKKNDIENLTREHRMKSINLSILQKSLNSVITAIVHKDTLYKINETIKTVRDVGIDIGDAEDALEDAAKTSDRLEMLTNAVVDSMESSSGGQHLTTADDSNGVPFSDVAPFDYEDTEMDQLPTEELTTFGLLPYERNENVSERRPEIKDSKTVA